MEVFGKLSWRLLQGNSFITICQFYNELVSVYCREVCHDLFNLVVWYLLFLAHGAACVLSTKKQLPVLPLIECFRLMNVPFSVIGPLPVLGLFCAEAQT